MKEKDFKALISLLDDQDPEVSQHVWQRLIAMGSQGVDQLEAAWEIEDDPTIQSRLEELIHRINLDGITDELLTWRKSGGKDLLEGWYILTKFQYPDLDLQTFTNEINRLVNKTWLEINDRMDVVAKMKVLNHILYVMEGYLPNRKKNNIPENNYLNFVLEKRQGNALSLSMLYLIVSQKLDFPLSGVILPGYFILYYNDGEKELYIDPFNKGTFFTKEDLKSFLKKIPVEEKPSYFKPTSHIYIILELINNMITDYKKAGNLDKAVELQQLQEDIEIKFEGEED